MSEAWYCPSDFTSISLRYVFIYVSIRRRSDWDCRLSTHLTLVFSPIEWLSHPHLNVQLKHHFSSCSSVYHHQEIIKRSFLPVYTSVLPNRFATLSALVFDLQRSFFFLLFISGSFSPYFAIGGENLSRASSSHSLSGITPRSPRPRKVSTLFHLCFPRFLIIPLISPLMISDFRSCLFRKW